METPPAALDVSSRADSAGLEEQPDANTTLEPLEKASRLSCDARLASHADPAHRTRAASPRCRGAHLGTAGGELRPHVTSDDRRRRSAQPGRLLVSAGDVAEPDAH